MAAAAVFAHPLHPFPTKPFPLTKHSSDNKNNIDNNININITSLYTAFVSRRKVSARPLRTPSPETPTRLSQYPVERMWIRQWEEKIDRKERIEEEEEKKIPKVW